MYNRYVDGLATFTPTDPAIYDQMGRRPPARAAATLQGSGT
jgi:hypothetical protein